MVATKKYSIIDTETGALDRRIFVDEAIYREELEKIFGRAWQMIGHVSLVPNRNDFFHTYMGEDPVILTRDNNGQLHAFLNMCRHRGNRIVRADEGNSKNFMCTYHGWTFSNDGRLEHVPGVSEAYYDALAMDELSLIEAKVDTYAGIVFATWDHEAPSLEAYLGDARWYLDVSFNRRDGGTIAYGPQKWLEPCNWKTPVDNCSDNYHVPVTHLSSMLAKNKLIGTPRTTQQEMATSIDRRHLFVNGHSLTFAEVDEKTPRAGHGMTAANRHLFEAYQLDTLPEVERRLGSKRARGMQLNNHSLFPNGVLGFRLALPRGPLMTEFWHFAIVDKDAPEDIQGYLRWGLGGNNGVAGLFEQDDIDNWRQVSLSATSPLARKYSQWLSMGRGHTTDNHPEYVGHVSERYISESNQRNFYTRWEEFMNADSWADISIEPIAADYQGSATLNS
ncbi:MAG: Rieske 2Fe-2S domain-containing protein [Dehalococcoidia bacterium]|nr:Rieske 2Fe-2S domain-containing protein [Dehalococcoidia bacterium]